MILYNTTLKTFPIEHKKTTYYCSIKISSKEADQIRYDFYTSELDAADPHKQPKPVSLRSYMALSDGRGFSRSREAKKHALPCLESALNTIEKYNIDISKHSKLVVTDTDRASASTTPKAKKTASIENLFPSEPFEPFEFPASSIYPILLHNVRFLSSRKVFKYLNDGNYFKALLKAVRSLDKQGFLIDEYPDLKQTFAEHGAATETAKHINKIIKNVIEWD